MTAVQDAATGQVRRAVAWAAVFFLVLSAGACRHGEARPTISAAVDGRAWCDAMPSAAVTTLPRVHRGAAAGDDLKTFDDPVLHNFVQSAVAYRGDRHVGRAAWWAAVAGSDFFVATDAAHAVFAGAMTASGTGVPNGERVIGVVGLRGSSGSWARRAGANAATVPAVLADGKLVVETVDQIGAKEFAGVLCALDVRTGRVLWGTTAQTAKMVAPMHLVLTSRAIVAVMNDDELVALDRRSGAILWRKVLPARKVVTAAGGQIVLSPLLVTGGIESPPNLTQVQGLDPQDGHVVWQVPVPPETPAERQDWSVIATPDGQPIVVEQQDYQFRRSRGTLGEGLGYSYAQKFVAYGQSGSLRWQFPEYNSENAFADGQQLFVDEQTPKGTDEFLAERNLVDGKRTWTVATGSGANVGEALNPTNVLLVDDGPRGRSLLIDRRTGSATPVLPDCLSCVGKTGISTSAVMFSDALVITGTAPGSQTVVGYPLCCAR